METIDPADPLAEGARQILSNCLVLRPGDVLAMFWDESTATFADYIEFAADELGLDLRKTHASLQYQWTFRSEIDLRLEDLKAMSSARAVLTCLSSDHRGTNYRSALLRFGTDHDKRFGHIPGATLDILGRAVTIDYAQAVRRCDDLALALTLGRRAVLQTYVWSPAGEPLETHDLILDIGDRERPAVTSTGIIPVGTWGNLPGGETFIAPKEDAAEGTFVVNGAFKNYVFAPPSHLLLDFRRGRLASVRGDDQSASAFWTIVDYAKSKGDRHFDSLAELGIGVNPGIPALTGNALFDEKCAGTAHIAIGDGTGFGGVYSSCIHEDLISWKPSLTIDGHPILAFGEDVFDSGHWRESLFNVKSIPAVSNGYKTIHRTTIRNEPNDAGTLTIRRDVAVGRVCNYTVGEHKTSVALNALYSLIPELPDYISYESLSSDLRGAALQIPDLRAAISILLRHGLIEVSFQ